MNIVCDTAQAKSVVLVMLNTLQLGVCKII